MTIVATNAPANTPASTPDKQTDTVVGAPAPEATKPDVDPRLLQLARSQKLLRDRQRQLDEREKGWTQEKETLAEKAARHDALVDRLKTDPYGAMLELGMTADQASALMLNQPDPTGQHVQLLKTELQSLKDELAALKNGQKDSETNELEVTRKQMLHDVKTFVATNPEYEALALYGETAQQAVVQLIEETFEKDGLIIDTKDAADKIEAYLLSEAEKAAGLKKVQARLAPKPAPTTEANTKPAPTLSNGMVPPAKPLTRAQKREEIIARMKAAQQTT